MILPVKRESESPGLKHWPCPKRPFHGQQIVQVKCAHLTWGQHLSDNWWTEWTSGTSGCRAHFCYQFRPNHIGSELSSNQLNAAYSLVSTPRIADEINANLLCYLVTIVRICLHFWCSTGLDKLHWWDPKCFHEWKQNSAWQFLSISPSAATP